jgi:hypothetical protein
VSLPGPGPWKLSVSARRGSDQGAISAVLSSATVTAERPSYVWQAGYSKCRLAVFGAHTFLVFLARI